MPVLKLGRNFLPKRLGCVELLFHHQQDTTARDGIHGIGFRARVRTCKLFQKHGTELIGFWTPIQGEEAKNTLYYIIAFPDAEAQKKAWQDFRADPEWTKVKADSEKEGVLVNKVDSTNLKAMDYSPLR